MEILAIYGASLDAGGQREYTSICPGDVYDGIRKDI